MATYYGTIEEKGKIQLEGDISDLPVGKRIQVVILEEDDEPEEVKGITGAEILASGLVGMWADRDDIQDSTEFAENLRRKWERRE